TLVEPLPSLFSHPSPPVLIGARAVHELVRRLQGLQEEFRVGLWTQLDVQINRRLVVLVRFLVSTHRRLEEGTSRFGILFEIPSASEDRMPKNRNLVRAEGQEVDLHTLIFELEGMVVVLACTNVRPP